MTRQEITAQERELVLSLYEPGHPVRAALEWEATGDMVPVNATVLADELARVVVALGARTTEADLIWIEELERTRRAHGCTEQCQHRADGDAPVVLPAGTRSPPRFATPTAR